VTFILALQYLNDALFVGLAVVCAVQWKRQGGRVIAWLTATFGVLAVVVLTGLLLNAWGAKPPPWATKAIVALLLLFPYLLLRFAASLDPPRRSTEVGAGVLTGVVLGWTLLLPALPDATQPRPGWLSLWIGAIAFQWTALSLVVAISLWRAGHGQSTTARGRMRRLSLGAAGLSLTMILAALVPSAGSGVMAVISPLLSLASGLLFYLSFAPPASHVLPGARRHPELETLRHAMKELMAITRVEEVADRLLPLVIRTVAGRGAALVDPLGAVLGAEGETPGLEERARAVGASIGGPGQERPATGGGNEVLSLPLSVGTLLIWLSPYAPLFARRELELIGDLGTLTEVALERARAAELDSELVAVVEACGDAIISAGLDGVVRGWNPGAEITYGRSGSEVVGRSLAIVIPPDRAADLDDLLRRVALGERIELESRHVRPDGSFIDTAVTAAPLRDRAGQVTGVSVVARDISERKRVERTLKEARDAAYQANQAKSDFLSRMSHELRTPLNAILGFAQLLELDDLSDEQRENLHFIVSGGQHLLALINEVLDIAAIEAGRLPLSVEPVAVADVVSEAVDLIRPLAEQGAILLSSSAPAPGEHVLADRQRLKQVLLNLLSNAVKYNREGGSVRLTHERRADGGLRIKVADTGPGIPPASLERLFVPFERLVADQTSVEGTGLGLALSQRLAEAMGGALGVDTVLDQGSTFWIELPLTDPPRGAAEPAGDPAEERQLSPGRPLTVLYIEDNISNMELVERLLSRRGIRLITAMRPLLGLELAREHQPDLVLLDLHLPDLPGEEVYRRLRADPGTAGIPVVVLSADARPSLIRRLVDEEGVRDFLTKPLEVDRLYRLLDELAEELPERRSAVAPVGPSAPAPSAV
jgi:PAS domain S-box-containing protein